MKLNIGSNIYAYRKKVNMTQKQFADKLGVSYQSVSRWENGQTYPDMELLPAISEIFNISIDKLLNIPDKKKEKAAEEAFQKLAQASMEQPVNTEKVKELIRDIRRNYLGAENFWHFGLSVKNSVYRMPEVHPEVRLTVEAVLDGDAGLRKKNEAIAYMAKLEDDEHIENFLERYASERDMTKNALLTERYKVRGEWDKYEPLRQLNLFEHVDQMTGNESLWQNFQQHKNADELLLQNSLQLNLLHQLCLHMPDEKHPVSGNGEIDCWIDNRIWLGFRRAGYLAEKKDLEQAFTVLEDTVSLIEKAMQITSPIELRCNSLWLDSVVWIAEESWTIPYGSALIENQEERCIWIHNSEDCCYVLHPSWYESVLTATGGQEWYCDWKYFNPLREEKKYQEYVERLHKLVQMRTKE